MKKISLNMIMALGVALLITACDGNGSKSDENQTVPVKNISTATCTIEQIPPTGYGIITVQVSCAGVTVINSATVTIDSVVQNVDFANGGVLYFCNVQPSTVYQAQLNVVADGEPLVPVIADVRTGDFETPPPVVETTATTPAPTPAPDQTPDPTPDPQQVCEDNGGTWYNDECYYL